MVRKFIPMVAIFVAVTMILAGVAPAFAQQGDEIQVTDSESRADQPDVAVDSNGNVHIAYFDKGDVYYQAFGTSPNRYTVIQWKTGHYDEYGPGKFQAILYENGDIDANIADSTGVDSPITGVNLGDGTYGVDIGGAPSSNTSYRFTWDGDSDYDYSAITYNWIDASGGNPVGATADDSSGTVPVGFDFTFYGTSYDTVYVSSNGYMSFTDTDPTEWDNPASFPSSDTDTADVIAPLWDDWNTEREIWYTMLDNNGNTLIDDTLISLDDDANSVHPAIAVDSNDMVHIVWQDYDGEYIEYTKLDPSLDDQDGDAADEPTITVVDDTDLYYNSDGYQQHPRIAVDSDDDIHIVWEDYDEYNIYYMKVDNNGNVLVAETVIRSVSSLWYSRPDVAVDSNDNAHITWNDYEYTDSYEVYYMMLDGSDGSTLIDATLITPDDDEKSKRQTIVVDAQDMVHIIWADYRSPTGYNEIFHTKLDPSRDDQDGDDADEGVITVIDDTMLTPDDEDYSAHPQSAIQYGRYIHVAWYDNYGDYSWDIYYMVLDTDGNILVPVKVLTTTNTVSYTTSKFDNQPSLDVDSNGKAHIVWCDDRTGDYEVWYTTYQGPPCPLPPPPPAPIVGGTVYPVDKVGILMPWLGLAFILILALGGGALALRRR